MLASTFIHSLISLSLMAAAVHADFYVAPNGSDDNPGTADAPFATLAKARDAVRELVREGLDKDVTVLIRGGVYLLDEPLVFGPEDSGTEQHAITYAAYVDEAPIISGGRAIAGWREADGGRWEVELPEAGAGEWHFRQLFANGTRLPRARFPNAGQLLKVENVSNDVTEIAISESPGDSNLADKDAELVMIQNWSISRVAITRSDGKNISVANPMGWIGHGSATTASPGKPVYAENAPEFVDQPGEWYLDRATGILTYMAGEGEDPNAREFVAPKAEQLLAVIGKPGAPVLNLHFKGLAFEHTAWPLPKFGYLGIQAGHHGTQMDQVAHVLPLAIEFAYAVGCSIESSSVKRTGACAIGFGPGCQRNKVARCELADIGGNGIMVGWRGKRLGKRVELVGDASLDSDWENPADVPKANEIVNNTIHACGTVNHGCVGVYDAFCEGTKIAHNLVHDMPYTGISVGFRWNESETSQRATLIKCNHVHNVMKTLADGGCIYTLGYQPGTVLRGNLLHNVHRSTFAHGGAPNNGIFFDQGSKGYRVEANVIYDTSGDPIRFNQTSKENMTWESNSFGPKPGESGFPEEIAKQAGPE